MADPRYPDVPQVPGVPAVYRDAGNAAATTVTAAPMTNDAPDMSTLPATRWGIFADNGSVALVCDSVVTLEPAREFRVSDYPVEGGGFASYNKVALPGDTRVSVTKGGTDSDRQSFLDALDQLVASTDLVSIITPDSSFLNRNAVHYDYHRASDRGKTLLTVDIQFTEIRQTAVAQFADSKQPSGTPTTNAGPVQAIPATAKETPAPAGGSANPNVQAIPALTSASSAADKAATVSGVVAAGGTVSDLVDKGVAFQSIPLITVPAQTLTTSLGGQSVRLEVLQKARGLFVNVYSAGKLIIAGVKAENDNAIVRSAYLGFLGDLFFHDTQSGGSDAPSFDQLGSRYVLLYAGA